MHFIKKCLGIMCFVVLVVSSSFAAKDPIGWQLTRSFVNPMFSGRTDVITYTFTNQLPFQLVHPIVIQKIASPASSYSYVDTCTNQRLIPNQSCTVQVTFSPLIAGTSYLQLVITGYDKNRVPLPQLITIVQGASSLVYGVVSNSLPATMDQGDSEPYSFTFFNNRSDTITGVVVTSNQSDDPTFVNGCGSTLNAHSSCTVSGIYTAVNATPTVQSVTANFFYNQGSTISLSTSTTVVPHPTGVFFTISDPLPPIMAVNTSDTLSFLFHNQSGEDIKLSGNLDENINITSTGSTGTYTAAARGANNNCTNGLILQNNQNCILSGVYAAPASAAQVTITATQGYHKPSTAPGVTTTSISTVVNIVAAIPTTRTITVTNNCSFTVWFSLNGSQLNSGASCPCAVGSSCNTSDNKCYWQNHGPGTLGTFQLANGQSSVVTIPSEPHLDSNIFWSGNISASTLCSGTTCGQAACGNLGGTQACSPGVGFTQPATEAEITMNINQNDSYDVEVINGYHIPISVTPYFASGLQAVANNYQCGVPGSGTTQNGFGGCDFTTLNSALVPGNGFYWVTSGGAACNISSSSCPVVGTVCGLDSSFNQTCGNFLGYWTADEVCGSANVPAAITAYFQCNAPLPARFPTSSVLSQLMLCAVPTGDTSPTFNTCYNTYSSGDVTTCCGCKDWWTIPGVLSNSSTASCPTTDPDWNSSVQNNLTWLKQACPSIYVYPFDDKTSGFGCTNNTAGQTNTTSYTVTFCPATTIGANKDGKAAGVTEGR